MYDNDFPNTREKWVRRSLNGGFQPGLGSRKGHKAAAHRSTAEIIPPAKLT